MVRVLARIPSGAERRKIKAEVKQTLFTLDIRANHAPTYAIDVYKMLGAKDAGFLAGLVEDVDGVNAEYRAHNDELLDEDTVVGMEFARCTLPQDC